MSKAEHECIIGLIYSYENTDLVTLRELLIHIAKAYEMSINPFLKGITTKVWNLGDYADRRKSTDLYRFDFCPVCGKAIDWKSIKTLAKTAKNL